MKKYRLRYPKRIMSLSYGRTPTSKKSISSWIIAMLGMFVTVLAAILGSYFGADRAAEHQKEQAKRIKFSEHWELARIYAETLNIPGPLKAVMKAEGEIHNATKVPQVIQRTGTKAGSQFVNGTKLGDILYQWYVDVTIAKERFIIASLILQSYSSDEEDEMITQITNEIIYQLNTIYALRGCVISPTPHPGGWNPTQQDLTKKSYCHGVGGISIPDEFDTVNFVIGKMEQLFKFLFPEHASDSRPEKSKLKIDKSSRKYNDQMKIFP